MFPPLTPMAANTWVTGGMFRKKGDDLIDRKSTRLNSSHSQISYAVFCLKKKNNTNESLVDLNFTPSDHALSFIFHQLLALALYLDRVLSRCWQETGLVCVPAVPLQTLY